MHIHPSDLLASEQQTPVPQGKSSEHTVLSKEACKLLEHLKTEIAAYNAKLTSGEIEFSITMSGPKIVGFVNSKRTENMQQDPKGEPPQQKFEVNKHWHIICRFEGARKFYHIKQHIKTNSKGVPIANSQVTHIEIEVNGNKRQGRQNTGSGWQPILRHEMPQIPLFNGEFHPGWWGWAPLGYKFSDPLQTFQPIDVQRVETEAGTRYVITSSRIYPHESTTHKIWLDPQKGYRITRILRHRKTTRIKTDAPPGTSKNFEWKYTYRIPGTDTWVVTNELPGNPPKPIVIPKPIVVEDNPLTTSKNSEQDHYTYKLAQFKPGIWFPQTAILERIIDTFDNRKLQQPYKPYRKITMQVHKAVFNIPIAEKALRFPD